MFVRHSFITYLTTTSEFIIADIRSLFMEHITFKERWSSCELEGGLGILVTATMKVMIKHYNGYHDIDPWLSVKQLSNILDISIDSAYTILSYSLHMLWHHSNTPSHVANVILEFLSKKATLSYHTAHTVQIMQYATSGC